MSQEYGYQTIPGDDLSSPFENDIDYEDGDDDIGSEKFVNKSKHQDWPFTTIFAMQVMVVCLFSILTSAHPYEGGDINRGSFTYEQKYEVMEMTAVVCIISLMLATFWIVLLQVISTHILTAGMFSFFALSFLSAIVLVVCGAYFYSFLAMVAAACGVWFSMSAGPRVVLSSQLLKFALKVIRTYPATIIIGLVSSGIQVVWLVIWSFLVVNLFSKGSGVSWFEIFLLVLSLFWTTQVIKHIVHVAIAECMSTWYFMHETGMPMNPTLRGLRHATTSSFGSVCLGSLLLAIFNNIRSLVILARRTNNTFLIFVASCVMRLLDDPASIFNPFALAFVAIYGRDFVRSGKEVWVLVHSRGVDSLSTSHVIDSALNMACMSTAIFCALCGGLWANQHDNMDVAFVTALCFVAGYSVHLIALEPIQSAVVATMVCYAEDPEILSRSDPALFTRVREACGVEHNAGF